MSKPEHQSSKIDIFTKRSGEAKQEAEMSIQEDLESCEDEQLFDNQPVKIVHNLTLFMIAVSVDLITSISTILCNSLHNSLLFKDLLQPMRPIPSPPTNLNADEVEPENIHDRETPHYTPQKRPFSIDRYNRRR